MRLAGKEPDIFPNYCFLLLIPLFFPLFSNSGFYVRMQFQVEEVTWKDEDVGADSEAEKEKAMTQLVIDARIGTPSSICRSTGRKKYVPGRFIASPHRRERTEWKRRGK